MTRERDTLAALRGGEWAEEQDSEEAAAALDTALDIALASPVPESGLRARLRDLADEMDEEDVMTGRGLGEFADALRAALASEHTGEAQRCLCGGDKNRPDGHRAWCALASGDTGERRARAEEHPHVGGDHDGEGLAVDERGRVTLCRVCGPVDPDKEYQETP